MTEKPNPVIDQVRAMIQWAYSEQAGASGSVFEVFSGKQTKKSVLSPSKRPAGLSPTRVHAVESRKQGKSRLPIASGRSGGEVKRAVAELQALHQHWIHLIYNPSREKKASATLVLYPALWKLYVAEKGLKGSHSRTVILTQFMLKIQLQQARSFPSYSKWTESRPEMLENAISLPSWSDTYKAKWISVRAILERLDTESLMAAYNSMNSAKGLELAE